MKHKDVTMPTRPHWVVEVDLFARFSCNEGRKDQEHQENPPQLHHQRFNVQDRNNQKILNQDNLANRKNQIYANENSQRHNLDVRIITCGGWKF